MNVVLIISIFWIIYGILGLAGIQWVPKKHRGKDYEKDYIRARSLTYLILGVPFLIFGVVYKMMDPDVEAILLLGMLILAGVPGIIYDRKIAARYDDRQIERAKLVDDSLKTDIM